MSNAKHLQRGVSLIELMVSLVIGTLLIIGAVSVYMQSRSTYRTNESAARLQEVARYALDVIEPDVRMAGYWGLTNFTINVVDKAGPLEGTAAVAVGVTNDCGNNWTVDAEHYLDGRDQNTTGYDLDCDGIDPAAGADTLIVRRANANVSAPTNGRFQIQSNRVAARFVNDGTSPLGADPARTETHDLLVNAYYISNPAGTGTFALRRQTLNGMTIEDQEIIQGVQDLQVQFGIDLTGGDNSADQYVNSDAVPVGAQVVSARIWLLVVAPDMEVGFEDGTDYAYANASPGTFSDHRRRLLVSKTIQIRNSTLPPPG